MSENENLHKDHRKRLRKRYAENGLLSFEDHNILELLLFYTIPRRDTNPIAHRLMEKFKTLHGVFDASTEELCEVDGIGESSAEYLKLCGNIARESALSELTKEPFIRRERIGAFFTWFLRGLPWETSCILMLDEKMNYVFAEVINLGKEFRPSSVKDKAVEIATQRKCTYAYLAHSHPDGKMRPSPEDLLLTSEISAKLKENGIELAGHYIVYKYDYLDIVYEEKMKERELRRKEFEI